MAYINLSGMSEISQFVKSDSNQSSYVQNGTSRGNISFPQPKNSGMGDYDSHSYTEPIQTGLGNEPLIWPSKL